METQRHRSERDFGSVERDPTRPPRVPDFGSVARSNPARHPRVPDFGSAHRRPVAARPRRHQSR
jgi:hypothetical protein